MLRTIISVDPGKSGAITVIDGSIGSLGSSSSEAQIKIIRDFKDPLDLCEILLHQPHYFTAVFERVHSMPRQGVKSMFTFGMWYGWQQGLLVPFAKEVHYLEPIVWQRKIREVFGGAPLGQIAASLFPSKERMFLGRKKDHNTTDAALIGVAYALGVKSTQTIKGSDLPGHCVQPA